MLGIPAIAVSQQSGAREMDFRLGREFDFAVAAAFAAELVARLAAHPLPDGTLINVNCPAGEPSGVEVTHLGKRLYNDELKLVEERTAAAPLRDLRLRALVRGRGGLRPLGDRAGPDLGHAAALRPHRPRRASTRLRAWDLEAMLAAVGGDGEGNAPLNTATPASDGSGRRRSVARASSRAEIADHDRATTSSTTPRSRTPSTTTLLRRAARARGGRTPSCARPTRRPSGSAASRSRGSSRSSTPSRCSRSATPATRRSCAPGRSASQPASSGSTSSASEIPLRHRAEDRRPRDLAHLRGRRAHPRRHPRRRAGRRGRDPQPAHDRRRSRCGSTTRPSWSRCAARSTCRSRASRS